MRHIGLNRMGKMFIAAVVNSFTCCLSFAQSSDKIPFAEIGPLSLDSGTAWVQRVFDHSISNDVQVVGLGEVSHGGYEPLALKAKMVQYLVENKGYRNLLLELADMGPVRPVRQYLLDNNIKDLSVADSLAKTVIRFQNAQEVFRQLFRWLKLYNLAHPREMVKVTGFDLSFDAGFRNFLMNNYIIPLDHNNAQRLLYFWGDGELPDTIKMTSMNTWFNASKSKLAKVLPKNEFDELQYYLKNEKHSIHYEVLTSGGYNLAVSGYRDSILADNVTYLAGSQKNILWAHNGHISTNERAMGRYLRERYQSRYFILLTDFSKEANVYVDTEEKDEPTTKTIHEQHFTAGRTTIAYNLLNNYGLSGGIFFDQNFPLRKVYSEINSIDVRGLQTMQLSDKPFDVLVIFKTITLQPANNR